MAIADLVKTTLGPKGMDKILQSTGRGHSVIVTNDGAKIFKSLHIDHPAAKLVGELHGTSAEAKAGSYPKMNPCNIVFNWLQWTNHKQDDEVGDGTTSVVVLAGEHLREAEKLVNSNIHPMTIISGFRLASKCARNVLERKVVDNKQDAGIVVWLNVTS